MAGLLLLFPVCGIALLSPVLTPSDTYAASNPLQAPPSWAHPMGTDNFQRDMLALVIQGLRRSMTVVVSVVGISSLIGVSLGVVAGYAGGVVDDAVTRLAELFQTVPRFFLAFLVIGLYGPGLSKIVMVLGVTSWPLLARVVRAETLSIKRRPFVEASLAVGASGRRIVLTHILPNVFPQAVVIMVLTGSRVILIEAGLAFLGLGDPSKPSLGLLARNAQDFLTQSWWLAVFPGLAIVTAVLGMNLLSDGLNQTLDPRSALRAQKAVRATTA